MNTRTVSLIVFGTLKFTIFKTIEGVKKFQQSSRQRLSFLPEVFNKSNASSRHFVQSAKYEMLRCNIVRTKMGVSNFMSAIIGVILFMTLKVMFVKISNKKTLKF